MLYCAVLNYAMLCCAELCCALCRWLYCVAAGFAFRWMYYFIWSVAEVAMVLSEFGYSGPSDHDPLWYAPGTANAP